MGDELPAGGGDLELGSGLGGGGRRLLGLDVIVEPDFAAEGARTLHVGVFGVDTSSYSMTVFYGTFLIS